MKDEKVTIIPEFTITNLKYQDFSEFLLVEKAIRENDLDFDEFVREACLTKAKYLNSWRMKKSGSAPIKIKEVIESIKQYNLGVSKQNKFCLAPYLVYRMGKGIGKASIYKYFKRHKKEIDEYNSSHGLTKEGNSRIKKISTTTFSK